jgi:hypothetical protein
MQEQLAVCKRLYPSGIQPKSVYQKENWQSKTGKNAGVYSMSDYHFNVGYCSLNGSPSSILQPMMAVGRTVPVGV